MELPAHLEATSAWRDIRAELRRTVGESTYDIWLAALELETWDDRTLVLKAPSATRAWVAKRFARVIETCARAVTGSAVQVGFEDEVGSIRRRRPSASDLIRQPALNPRYTFDQFVIGDSNRLAHAAALVVAEQPGQTYNPLFLNAPPGLGKTHLLHAIGNFVLAFGSGARVRYTTVETFTNQFIAALGSRSLDSFKRDYRDADVVLIDDVQFLASKAKTEEEFFHTFNALHENGRQLVLTCDRLPGQLLAVEERLRDRFESGLVADIRPPDYTTRVAILRKRAQLDAVKLADPQVLELIAQRITDNVRTLEGALIRIVAHHSLTGRPIDFELASELLDQIHPRRHEDPLSLEHIQETVADRFQLSTYELTSPSRTARVAWPRQVAIYLAKELTDCSLSAIGQAFGGRSHATVMHACKRVADRVLGDEEAASQVERLTRELRVRKSDRSC